ncbi:MAG TPA: hypothetical protein DCP28_08170 [Cytophagales bacterium]|nr:hypothetical protein [Cytophagales bacterium]
MDKFLKLRVNLGIVFSTIFVTISYEIKRYISEEITSNPILFAAFVVIIGYIISNTLTNGATNFLLKSSHFRKMIFRKKSIEGDWTFNTFEIGHSKENLDQNPSKDNLLSPSYLNIQYDSDQHAFKVVGYRTKPHGGQGDQILTNSIFSKYDSTSGEYFNVFHLADPDDGIKLGLAYGHFFSIDGNGVNTFHGRLMFQDKDLPLSLIQVAKKGHREQKKSTE